MTTRDLLLKPEPVAGTNWTRQATMIAVVGYTNPNTPGLAVVVDQNGIGYTVTHIASGRALPMCAGILSLTEAMRQALAIAPLIDWTQPMKRIRASRGLAARIDAAIARPV